MTARRILLWPVHGSWTTSFVQGEHHYLMPTLAEGGPWGGGRGDWGWPTRVHDVPANELPGADVDLVLLQRPDEVELAERWLGRRLGNDVPAIYVEHNTPRGDVPLTCHHLAGRGDITVVHVTHFNDLMWDSGRAPTVVIEHGILDPGYRYRGDLQRAAVVVNEPIRRWRVTGTDLLPAFAPVTGMDVFGMGTAGLAGRLGLTDEQIREAGDLHGDRLYDEVTRRRLYLHPVRWTSLGLSLIEAMHLGMPVVALASTEASRAIPPGAGVVSTRVPDLVAGVRRLLADPELARAMGEVARESALANYGLARFLSSWDQLIETTTSR